MRAEHPALRIVRPAQPLRVHRLDQQRRMNETEADILDSLLISTEN